MTAARLGLLAALVPAMAAWSPVKSRSGAVDEGNARMKAGKPEEALAAYDRAVAETPKEPGVHFDRGTALYALSRFDEAAEEFMKATVPPPARGGGFLGLGDLFEPGEAQATPLRAAAFYNLGNALFKKDKFKEAAEAYKHALALDPKDERAKWNLEIALKKQRDEEEKKKKEDEKKKDDQKKDDQKDKNDKKDDQKKDDQKKKQDEKKKDDQKDKKDDQKKDEGKKDEQKKNEDQAKQDQPQPEQKDKAEKPASDKEIGTVLDSLEKSPKDLEKQRARLRAVRRAPPARDW